jgi:phosphoribosylamine--glycine ligase
MLPTTSDAAVAVVLAAANYPEMPRKGDAITGLDEAARAGATVFHAGTVRGPDGGYRTNGGRVLAVVGLGATVAKARTCAEEAADHISWAGMQRRHDIAAKLPRAAATPPASASPDPVSEKAWTQGGAS